MKRVIHFGLVSTGLLFGTLLFATDCNIQEKGCEREFILLKNNPYAKYEIDSNYLELTMHKLKSIQGKFIEIIEKKNGFEFPQYSNKIVVLEFFGKNCHHCIKEIASLNKIRKKYNQKLEVVSIQVEAPMEKYVAQKLIKKHNIKYHIIDGDESIGLQSFIQETYDWRGILPYTLVIKDGLTEFSYSGKVTYQEMQSDISSLI